ncbi:MAG: translocation/assembly module TamB domain-containing protein [Proteobacteria bacterium]|nr:translocation/assembly module TamB domain-containing protein [Pseudomonadota bacterium]
MSHRHDPNPYAAAAAPRPQPAPPRRGHRALLAFELLLATALALLLALWWWAGSNTSLATVLTRAAHYLPEGQSLESRDVTGSLRAGGRIGWLRWSSPTLAVELQDARIVWNLTPLLRRKLQLKELQAAQITLTPQGEPSSEPLQPLQQLVLPLRLELPFAFERITWAAASPVTIAGLAGRYHYDGTQHRLDISQVTLAQGRYALQAQLQARAPMALTATLNGSVHTPVPGSTTTLQAQARAQLQGSLASTDARLNVTAQLRGEGTEGTPPLHADLQASLAPWAGQPLLQAAAELQALNLAALWPQAPHTRLSGSAGLEPAGNGWRLHAALRNAEAGPWDHQRLPFDQLQARAAYDGQQWTLPEAQLHIGQGRVSLQGSYTPATQALQGRAELRALNPAALHTLLDAAPVSGQASADGDADGAVRFSADLRGSQPARAPTKAATKLRLEQLTLQGRWHGEQIELARLQLAALQAQVTGQQLRISTAAPALQGRLQAQLPGATARFDGQIAPHGGQGQLGVRLADAQRAQRWLQALPGLGAVAQGWRLDGNAELQADWRGGWQTLQQQLQAAGLLAGEPGKNAKTPGDFELQAKLTAPRLQATRAAQAGVQPLTLELLRATASLGGTLAQARLQWDGELRQRTEPTAPELRAQLQLQSQAGSRGAGRWQAQIDSLTLQASASGQSGPWTLRLANALSLDLRQSPQLALDAGAGQASITGPAAGEVQLRWQPLAYAQGAQGQSRLRSQGELLGLPLAWANAWRVDGQAALARLGLGGNLVLNAAWDVDLGDRLRASARLRRASGDLNIAGGDLDAPTVVHSSGPGLGASAVPAQASTPAGLRQAELTLSADGDALRAQLAWDSERAGRVQAEGQTRLSHTPDGWAWPEDAQLAASVRAELPDVGVWSTLAPPGWRVRGSLSADARLAGTRAAPRWSGQLAADQFGVRSLLDGVDLRDGRLRATLQGDRLQITELLVHGGQGSRARIAGYSGNLTPAPQDGGTLSASGSVTWGGAGLAMDLRAKAQALQLLVRADRQLSVSGELQAGLQGGQFTLRGKLTTDRATIILPESSAPTLGSDVVVHSAALDRQRAAQAAQASQAGTRVEATRPPDIAITLNLGDDFALQGHGITTRLTGELDIRSSAASAGQPRVTGELRTVQGRYRAWGQALDVESGLLRFNGPYDNPALDVLALRPNISVRAGVQVTGTAQAPRVRLYSDPELPDAEKLSWVVLGRSASAGGAEAAVLQQAALALLGRGGGGDLTGGIARQLGLDEIGFKGPQTGTDTDGAEGAALTLGKRLSKDLYVTYERSLSGVLGTIYIFYDLSKRLQLRGQTGVQSAVDLIYTVRYD